MNALTAQAIHLAMRLMAKGLAAGRLRTNASGLENIPAAGPALLVARHYHHLFDGLALFAALGRPFHIVVTLDWARNACALWMMECMTRIARWPVILRRDALSHQEQLQRHVVFTASDVIRYERRAMRQAVELLASGSILVIFPEGYPNIDPHYTPKIQDNEMLHFKSGFAAIAAAAQKRCGAKIPLIPVGFRYTAGKKWTVHVSFGAALSDGDFACREALVKRLEQDVARHSELPPPLER